MATKKTTNNAAVTATTSESTSPAIPLRGKEFVGRVVSAKANKTVTVQWEWRRHVKKYERYESRTSKVAAHNPPEIDAQEGDLVRIKETRPLSKTKHFMVVEIIKEEKA